MSHVRRAGLFLLVLLLAPAMLVPAPARAESIDIVSPRFADAAATDGTYVVWAESHADLGVFEIYGARLSDGTRFPIATGALSPTVPRRSYPSIDRGIVVWVEQFQSSGVVRGKNLATGDEFVIHESAYNYEGASISGDVVVWASQNSTQDAPQITARNIRTMEPPLTLGQIDGLPYGQPQIDGDRVAWVVVTAYGRNIITRWRLMTITLNDRRMITIEGAGTPRFDLKGDTIVYTTGEQIIASDLAANRSVVLDARTERLTFDGSYIFWESFDERVTSETQPAYRIMGHHLPSGSTFRVTDPSNAGDRPRGVEASSGLVLWHEGGTTRPATLRVVPTVDVLPSARRAARPRTPEESFFPETGHYLAFGFRNFWQRNGALPVFGFPLTEEFDERNPDTGATYTVQYFERQRYEYHPENGGTPYEVLLGRLGAQEAERRGLMGSDPFRPLLPETRVDADCTFFRETGHRACSVFREYWSRYGLDFGDPGISFRESLALWGYPISEPYFDAEIGRTIQYFERARFEDYSAVNPDPYRVLFGRLGVDLVDARGWPLADRR